MISKTGLVVLTFSIALFASGRFEQFIAHGSSSGSLAWAQDATDADDGSDLSTEPDTAPPDIAGDWSGDIVDEGTHSFTIEIFQKHSKLKGDYATADATGTFVGKIKADGVSLTFKFKQKHSKCRIKSEATLTEAAAVPADVPAIVPSPEIEGTFTAKHCEGASSGSFTLNLE